MFASKKACHIFLIQLIATQLLLAGESVSQNLADVRLNFEIESLKLEEVFMKLENSTGFKFGYDKKILNPKVRLTISEKDVSMEEILLEVAERASLKFKRINNQILVLKDDGKNIHENKIVIIENVDIRGKITDEHGEGLPGASIIEKGTTNGTTSNLDGTFRLSVAEDAILTVSFVGYKPQDVSVAGRTTIDIQIEVDAAQLEEIVVVGYGTAKRSDLTGSVSSVKEQELKAVAIASLDQGLQGRIAGVHVSQSSAAPGGSVSVRIRGVNSINGTNEPLYVIDGIPILTSDGAVSPTGGGVPGQGGGGSASNSLSSINPGDIESIEVLKDASATAIYGARGANGVIIVTTKQGKAGATKVGFDSYYGVQGVAKTYDVLDAGSFGVFANEYAVDQGLQPYFDQSTLNSFANNSNDWQDKIYQTAGIQNYQLTVSGGDVKTTFAVGANYFKQSGVIKNSGFERYSLRLNLNHNVSDKLKVGITSMFSRLANDRVSTDGSNGVPALAQEAPPIVPVYNADGSYTNIEEFGLSLNPNLNLAQVLPNPISVINEVWDKESTNRMMANFYGDYEIFEGLSIKVTLGSNISNRNRDTYYSQNTFEAENIGGAALVGTSERVIFLNENTISYNKTINTKHQINAVGGFSTQYEVLQGRSISNSGFGIDDAELSINDIGSGTQLGGPAVSSFKRDESLASFIFRGFYSYDERYLLTFTGRSDGSSKFSKGNKWGFFPSIAAGWRINNESFMESAGWVTNLKLRASYGQSGFQEIPPYLSLARYGSQNYSFGDVPVVGYEPVSPANTNLTWQTTEQIDVGLDFGFLENRFTITADYYVKNTDNLLLFVRVPANTGYSTPLAINVGEVKNQGWEFSVGTNLSAGDLKWSSNVNLSSNKNEVIDLGPQDRIFGGRLLADRKDDGNLTKVGEPIGIFFGYKSDGIFKSDDEVAQHTTMVEGQPVIIQPNAKAGDRRFIDTNQDGDISSDDRTKIGDPYPDLIFGWSNNFSYKAFDLSFFFQGTKGNDIFNLARETLSENDTETNILRDRFDGRWTPTNTNATWPRAGALNPISGGSGGFGDYTVEDGSYIRMRDITLGYTIPTSNVDWLRRFRAYVSVQNAFTITNYSGVNPEASSQGQNATNFGVDLGGYPVARIYRIGLNIEF